MIPLRHLAGRPVAVFGLARSGLATARALVAGGTEVACWDDGEKSRAAAMAEGLPVVDLAAADWSAFAAVVLAPGVPLTHPEPHWTVERARAAGVPILGDTELFYREKIAAKAPARLIGITGTNGKSTTTALAAHVLRQAGLRVALGGNIGEAVLGLAPFEDIDAYVLELSSYQIDLSPTLACDAAALLNITPDHLDRHGTLAHYAQVKERLVANAATAVIGVDDDLCRAIAARRRQAGGPMLAISTQGPAKACRESLFVRGTDVYLHRGTQPPRPLGDLAGIGSLRGTHNMQNALAALAIATIVAPDLPWQAHMRACRTFPGLAHRLQQVARRGPVIFVDDSKATNADSTGKALSSFERDIFWIAGGRPKEGGIGSLAPYFPRIARAYLIGEAAEDFARTLDGNVPVARCGRLDAAVAAAAADASACAAAEPVVLLSPACASFDQFADFEDRGRAFVALVGKLPGVEAI